MHSATRYVNFVSGETLSLAIANGDYYAASTSDVVDIARQIKENYASPKFRIYILFPDESIDCELPAEDIKLGGNYNENYQAVGARRTLSFSLYNHGGKYTPDINVLHADSRLRLEMGVEMLTGEVFWFTKGVYVINSVSINHTPTGDEVTLSCADKYSLFTGKRGVLQSGYEIPPGTLIKEVIETILLTDMGNGEVFDAKPILMDRTLLQKTTQSTISKEIGDNYGSILSDLATQLSAEIFYNANGNLVITPISLVSDDMNKPLLLSYNTDSDGFAALNFSVNYESITNRVIVVGNSTSGGVFTATAVNDNPSSPYCYERVGYRTAPVIHDTNITSLVAAQERADYELRQTTILRTTTTADVLFNPLLEVNNLISITDDFYDLTKMRCLIQGVSCSLDYNNRMSVTFSNINNLPFLAK